jgi:molybdopterin converting factor small subunit
MEDDVAQIHLPPPLVNLFPGAPRRLEVEAVSVGDLIGQLNQRWPGMRDRLCENGPRIRQHINVFVDGERATLTEPLHSTSIVYILPAVSGG